MLEPSADEIGEWANSVTQFVIDYLGGLRDRPVYRQTSSREIRSGLDSKLPIKGTDLDSLLKVFRETIVPFSRQNAHPRMFGYVQSPGTPIGAFADLLASTLNANLTIWRSAPAPVELERLTIDWIRQILGFPPEAGGLLVSGGSMANLAAVAAARQTKPLVRSLAPVCVERDAFLDYQGSGAFGNRPGERPARRSRRTLQNAAGRSRGKNHC
jgi:aromatic-L-amino-acid/L-tryptophan decarboxylase